MIHSNMRASYHARLPPSFVLLPTGSLASDLAPGIYLNRLGGLGDGKSRRDVRTKVIQLKAGRILRISTKSHLHNFPLTFNQAFYLNLLESSRRQLHVGIFSFSDRQKLAL